MKKYFLTIISLLCLTGCNLTNQADYNNMDSFSGFNTFSDDAAKRLPDMPQTPFFAVFNNAYKGLFEENEAIGRQDPVNADKYYLSSIASAKETLDIAVYDIDDPGAVAAFIDAHKRGVKVRIITDNDNLKDKENELLPRTAIEDLKAAGIPVKDDKRSPFMHHKFMIIDNKTVQTGSLNLTTTSLYQHNNNIIFVNSTQLAANYSAEFNRMFDKGLFGPNPHEIPYPEININGISITTHFSPGGDTKASIIKELQKASKNIKVLPFSFTDKDMANVMIEKSKAGVKIDAIFDACMVDQFSAYNIFKANGIFVRRDGNQALMHHKVMIIDDETVITGSFNYSKNAEDNNNENTLIIKSKELANTYNKEFARLKYASITNINLPPYDHPACNHKSVGTRSVE
jgi:phosphatidylserine/phosphatidylglycerophosphate/cardiolipin synthase-like enzyme